MVNALLREITEETGLRDIRIENLLGTFENFFYYQPTDEAMHAFLFFFECSTSETQLLSGEMINDSEVTELQWMEIDKIKKEDLGDLNEELFKIINSLS